MKHRTAGNPYTPPFYPAARWSLRTALLTPLLALTCCGYYESRTAHKGQLAVIGMTSEDLQACAGIPDKVSKLDDHVQIFQYTRGVNIPSTNDSSLFPLQTLVNLSQTTLGGAGKTCVASLRLVDGYVTDMHYSGDNNRMIGTDGVCATVVKGCLDSPVRSGKKVSDNLLFGPVSAFRTPSTSLPPEHVAVAAQQADPAAPQPPAAQPATTVAALPPAAPATVAPPPAPVTPPQAVQPAAPAPKVAPAPAAPSVVAPVIVAHNDVKTTPSATTPAGDSPTPPKPAADVPGAASATAPATPPDAASAQDAIYPVPADNTPATTPAQANTPQPTAPEAPPTPAAPDTHCPADKAAPACTTSQTPCARQLDPKDQKSSVAPCKQ